MNSGLSVSNNRLNFVFLKQTFSYLLLVLNWWMVVNDELERMWEEAVMAYFNNRAPEFSWGLRKLSENPLGSRDEPRTS
jgi:hypothetical protein